MVELAASGGRLDGYRELAAKLAKKDEQIDRLRAEIERLREECLTRHADQRAKAEEIERLRATNHLDIVLPPFGHSFTLPSDRLDMAALDWMRQNCVIVTREEWERVRQSNKTAT
jgi:multidrug resistance efflux pump